MNGSPAPGAANGTGGEVTAVTIASSHDLQMTHFEHNSAGLRLLPSGSPDPVEESQLNGLKRKSFLQ